MNVLDSDLCRSCTQSDCVPFSCISQSCSQSQYTNLHLKLHYSWMIICSTPGSMQALLYLELKLRRSACVCHILQSSNSKRHSQGTGLCSVIQGTWAGLWHPAPARALACVYTFQGTVLCCWIYSWKGVYSCVNVEVHLPEGVTVCSLHGKCSYRILASTACMVRNATENY